jgi:hypothetical protein
MKQKTLCFLLDSRFASFACRLLAVSLTTHDQHKTKKVRKKKTTDP